MTTTLVQPQGIVATEEQEEIVNLEANSGPAAPNFQQMIDDPDEPLAQEYGATHRPVQTIEEKMTSPITHYTVAQFLNSLTENGTKIPFNREAIDTAEFRFQTARDAEDDPDRFSRMSEAYKDRSIQRTNGLKQHKEAENDLSKLLKESGIIDAEAKPLVTFSDIEYQSGIHDGQDKVTSIAVDITSADGTLRIVAGLGDDPKLGLHSTFASWLKKDLEPFVSGEFRGDLERVYGKLNNAGFHGSDPPRQEVSEILDTAGKVLALRIHRSSIELDSLRLKMYGDTYQSSSTNYSEEGFVVKLGDSSISLTRPGGSTFTYEMTGGANGTGFRVQGITVTDGDKSRIIF